MFVDKKSLLYLPPLRAISSVGSEHLVYTEGVGSSSLASPTIKAKKSPLKRVGFFIFICTLFKNDKNIFGNSWFSCSIRWNNNLSFCTCNGLDIDPLGEISFFVWITTWTISVEINKEQPKKWWVYTVIVLSLAAISTLLFVYS